MKYTQKTKWLAVLLAASMLVALLPAFFSFATEGAYEENPASLTKENGNLAIDASVISQYGAHNDAPWLWDIERIHNGSMDTVPGEQIGNGGYHSFTAIPLGNNRATGEKNHSEWVGYDFGEPTTFDTVVFYPCRDSDGICHAFPNTFSIDISSNGEDWITVKFVGDYGIPAFGPLTFRFEEVTAQYVRLNALSLNKDVNGAYYLKFSEFAVFNTDYVPDPQNPNYATSATVTSSPYHTDPGSWWLEAINDGNRYNVNQSTANDRKDFGQYIGWHTSTAVAQSEDAWIAFDLGSVKKVDRVVVMPGTERFVHGLQQDGSYLDNLHLPTSIKIETSENGSDWSELTALTSVPNTYAPIVIDFTATETQYVRVYMTRTTHVKLSEIEIIDTTTTVGEEEEDTTVVTKPDENLALDASLFYTSYIGVPGAWDPSFLNNGVIEEDGGFTTGKLTSTNAGYVGYEFDHLTTVNKVILYACKTNEGDIGTWSGLLKTFKLEYSPDGFNWYLLSEVTHATVPASNAVLELSFAAVNAKFIRINATDLYAKTSDYNEKYIQLAEMEVWYTEESSTLSTDDTVSAYLQTKPATDKDGAAVKGFEDLRIILVGNMEALSEFRSVTVTVTFELSEGGVKTLTKVLGGENSDYKLYQKITAAGETYVAAEGSAIFGNVITDIPVDAYTAIAIEITDSADITNILYQGYAN
ncbi:MAG: discoidin domain-containing protein [Clostridia bacterium]|nr:discoidin domain-containing protein [Clostridia bacterium]